MFSNCEKAVDCYLFFASVNMTMSVHIFCVHYTKPYIDERLKVARAINYNRLGNMDEKVSSLSLFER